MSLEEQPLDTKLLFTHGVLTGLTPLIPIPYLDDFARKHFQRGMVAAMSEVNGVTLDKEQVKILADELPKGGCCLTGCLVQLTMMPFKKLLRKFFYFLEWKRAIDLTTRTLMHGYLVDYILKKGLWSPAHRPAQEVREAIERVIKEVGSSPIEEAVREAFRGAGTLLRSLAGGLQAALSKLPQHPSRELIARALDQLVAEHRGEVDEVAERLRRSCSQGKAEEYLGRMRTLICTYLSEESIPASS